MAQDFSRKFYDSPQWRSCREYILAKYNYICQRCNKNAAVIVHHIEYLTPNNIKNPKITLGEENLIPLCRECHNEIHENSSPTSEEVEFDINGDVIKRGII